MPKELKWQLMYEGPCMGHLLAYPVFIQPFEEGKNTVMGRLTGFEYKYYLWYSDSANGGSHAAYYEQSDLDAALKRGAEIYFDQKWVDEWCALIDAGGKKVLDLMEAYRLEKTIQTIGTETLLQLVPKLLDLDYLLVSYLRCSQPQFTDAMRNRLYELIRAKVADANEVEKIFLALTQPEAYSLFTKEEIDWLSIATKARQDIQVDDVAQISREVLSNRYTDIYELLRIHTDTYALVPASDRTPAWDLQHFVDLLKTSLLSDTDFTLRREEIIRQYDTSLQEKNNVVASYELPNEALELGQRIAKVGLYRFKAGFYFRWMGYYVVLICQRFAESLGLLYAQLCSTTRDEFMDLLRGGSSVTQGELTRRARAELYVRIEGNNEVLWGEEALEKKKIQLGDDDYSHIVEIKGEVASLGLVRGIAFVFHWNDDVAKKMHDMPKGSILVAPQTHPTYMPAIRLASALVCDEGGVTGHAAIVSRELRKPCVIGLHIASRVIQTGDEIEVDANKGIVRILHRRAVPIDPLQC